MKVPTGKGQKQQSQEKEDHTAGVKTMCKENHSSGSTQPATHQSTDPIHRSSDADTSYVSGAVLGTGRTMGTQQSRFHPEGARG